MDKKKANIKTKKRKEMSEKARRGRGVSREASVEAKGQEKVLAENLKGEQTCSQITHFTFDLFFNQKLYHYTIQYRMYCLNRKIT